MILLLIASIEALVDVEHSNGEVRSIIESSGEEGR